jgi:hypothetical protein
MPEVTDLCAIIEMNLKNSHPQSLAMAELALELLKEIHKAQMNFSSIEIEKNPIFQKIQSLI